MKTKNEINKSGFTLIELLIVVLIIGILTSVALPMYKKAAERSKATEALSTMTAVAKSEHDFFLTKNKYTQDFADLDITLTDKDGNNAEDESFESNNYLFTLQDTLIKSERKNNEYTLYKLYENGNIYCLPQDHFICEQYRNSISKDLCENTITGLWHNSSSSCYTSEQDRCLKEYGSDFWQNDTFCGYLNQSGTNSNNRLTIGEGQKCYTTDGTCQYTAVEAGGTCEVRSSAAYGCYAGNFKPGSKCISYSSSISCAGSTFNGASAICKYTWNSTCGFQSTYTNGSICVGYGGNSCVGSSFTNNSICYANHTSSCGWFTDTETWALSTYDETSCCCGAYCPDYAPKCADIGKTCDPQYMQ